MELRQRAPLEGEVKGETEAEAGMPREDDRIQRLDVDHFNDEFLTDVIRAVTRRLQAGDAVDMAHAPLLEMRDAMETPRPV